MVRGSGSNELSFGFYIPKADACGISSPELHCFFVFSAGYVSPLCFDGKFVASAAGSFVVGQIDPILPRFEASSQRPMPSGSAQR